jgi:hypothetical protein
MASHDSIAAEIARLILPWQGTLFQETGPVLPEEISAAEHMLGVEFPPSYRAFLLHFGSGKLHYYHILGIRPESLWHDVVLANQLAVPRMASRYVRVIDTVGEYTFYLDTSRRDRLTGECPLVVFGPNVSGRMIAGSFLEFLQKVCAGLSAPPQLKPREELQVAGMSEPEA